MLTGKIWLDSFNPNLGPLYLIRYRNPCEPEKVNLDTYPHGFGHSWILFWTYNKELK